MAALPSSLARVARRSQRAIGALTAAALLIASCAETVPPPAPEEARATPSPTPLEAFLFPSPRADGLFEEPDPVFSVGARRARQIATVVAFLEAWSSGRAQDAVDLAGEDFSGSDCDYSAERHVALNGKTELLQWLQQRAVDNERIEVGRYFNANPEPEGIGLMGLTEITRSNDTLRAAGFPNGFDLSCCILVLFDEEGRIRGFFESARNDCRAS